MNRMKTPRRSRGFSLIEILIVVALIGLIMAFVGRSIFGGQDKAKFNLAKSQVEMVNGKLSVYQLDVGGVPNSLDQLVSNVENAPNWLGPYLQTKDLKDPWGNALILQKPGANGGAYSIVSHGADGAAGGEGTNQDIVLP